MKAIVLAAGEGTQLRPLTRTRPKPMLPIGNRPLLEHVIDACRQAGIDEFLFVVGYKRERIQNYFGDGDAWNVDIEYSVQHKQLGTGHAVLQARDQVDEEFIALNGDRIVEPDAISAVVDEHRGRDGPMMAITRAERPENYGVVELDGREVLSITEKPPARTVATEFINAGVYGFDPSVFELLESVDSDGELAVTAAIQEAETLRAVPFDGLWLDVSHLWHLLSVNARSLDRFAATTAESVGVHDQSTVVEPVALGSDVRVRPGARVLPGTSLGDNVEIGANAVVSNAVVLSDATIGDGAVVSDCVVGENATIEANTTVAGGETDVVVGTIHEGVRLGGVVGDNATVGGGATLAPGTVLGNDTTVGIGTAVDGRIEDGTEVRRG
ncbi:MULTISPECIES: sugar phosphate nucleotidyltransferase [Halolamina]|uniref:Bifunctional protein GlmU n=1 Tax=Halolamina pelagica TaxID=699431 RepID=A0A1I5QYQ7_9EURY|nr:MULTISPECIES: sugar phosphate nucleotidyltransferase [Halolamina]NHX35609.1 NTP transferase domain-containing protein [Halolamina sp. R1-12]SFP51385.1 glucose-1-phosphate thymidylyltransferase [Halolamina pelagica]